MSRKYKFHNPDGVYFITFAVQGWIDVFTHKYRQEYPTIPKMLGIALKKVQFNTNINE